MSQDHPRTIGDAGWTETQLKWVLRLVYGDALPNEVRVEGDVDVYGSNGPVGRHDRSNAMGPAIIVGRKGSFGKITYAERGGFCIDTAFYTDQRYADCDLRWAYWALQTLRLDEVSEDTGVPGLSREHAHSQRLMVPAREVQAAIAAFLDSETARIDALIEKKSRFIELLREKRQALITQAVTRGLDPGAAMKNSGIEWLGLTPAHWSVRPLRYLGEVIIGLTYTPEDIVDEGEGTLVLRASNIQAGKLAFDDTVYVNAPIPDQLRTRPGDILVCSRSGSRDLIGKCALIDAGSAGHTFGAFTTVVRSEHAEFVYYVLSSSLFSFQAGRFLTTTINQLTVETLKSFEVAVPPAEEQRVICSALRVGVGRIDAAIDAASRSVTLLKERRIALITAAVTGQIDVREAA